MKLVGPAPFFERNQHWFRIGLVFLVPAVLLVTFFSLRHWHESTSPAQSASVSSLATNWQAAIDLSPSSESRRTVFPYSVIPGGVRDARELTAAAAKDPVVSAHYSDFHLTRAHTIRLNQSTAMYVSYRVNDRVFWTRNRMVIPAGETLLTDGENLARVRCGNRLSALKADPVSASEPTREQLESPAFIPPLLADLLPGESASETPSSIVPPVPILPPAGAGTPSPTSAPFPPVLPPGVHPPSHSSTSSGPPSGPPSGPGSGPPPPVSTPEPAAWQLLLVATSLFALIGALSALLRK